MRDTVMRWLKKGPATPGEIIGLAIWWTSIYVLWSVAKARG